MRLVDADKLIEDMEKVKNESTSLVDISHIIGFQSVVDAQPTAYDVDKVVNELKLLQGNARLERKTIADEEVEELCDCDDWYDSGYTTGYLNAQINTYQKALDIVKVGGIGD